MDVLLTLNPRSLYIDWLFAGKRKLKSYDVVDEALTFFKQYMAENNIDLVTFFQDMDEDGSMAVSYDEFREGLRVCVIVCSYIEQT